MTITYVGESTFVSAGGASSPLVMTYPAVSNTNVLILAMGKGNSAATIPTPTLPAGWAAVPNASISGGDGAGWAADAGPRQAALFYKECDGTETGTFNVAYDDSGGGAVAGAQIHQFSKSSGTWGIVGTAGQDTSKASGAGAFSVTGSTNLDLAAGDALLGLLFGCSTGFNENPVITAAGITMGGTTERQSTEISGGNHAYYELGTSSVSSGSGTVAVTMACDVLADAQAGVGVIVRLREVTGAPPPPKLFMLLGVGS